MLGAVVAFYVRTFPAAQGHGVGPGAFPFLIGIGIAACGVVLIWSGRKQGESTWLQFEEWVRRPRMAFNGALVIGALLFYALAVDTIGFFITSFAILAGLFLAFGRFVGS